MSDLLKTLSRAARDGSPKALTRASRALIRSGYGPPYGEPEVIGLDHTYPPIEAADCLVTIFANTAGIDIRQYHAGWTSDVEVVLELTSDTAAALAATLLRWLRDARHTQDQESSWHASAEETPAAQEAAGERTTRPRRP